MYATVPGDVERIYITDGAPWHRHAERHTWLKDAVAEWLNSPLPEGWKVESSRGRDRMAGYFVHPRHPVGRWQRGSQHTEIRAVDEWFDPAGADPATVRTAFVLLWGALRQYWPDVVLMGSPSPTGRDLWSRTITKAGAKWADGYPVLSKSVHHRRPAQAHEALRYHRTDRHALRRHRLPRANRETAQVAGTRRARCRS
ncbi:hypothetical protein ACFU98_42775 [Streptomyces sp. NPDC057575]|uniref:hypothetical protein n=1 Tax=unclassified Streptomyces TaxID=2593676 RepID=UPI0036AF8CDB